MLLVKTLYFSIVYFKAMWNINSWQFLCECNICAPVVPLNLRAGWSHRGDTRRRWQSYSTSAGSTIDPFQTSWNFPRIRRLIILTTILVYLDKMWMDRIHLAQTQTSVRKMMHVSVITLKLDKTFQILDFWIYSRLPTSGRKHSLYILAGTYI